MATGEASEQSPEAKVYYAHRFVRGNDARVLYLHASPNRWWTALHGNRDPIVRVRLRERRPEDPPSPYWGWIDAKRPSRFCMVWPTELQLEMCFPYGSRTVEQHGYGRKVNLIMEELAEAP